MWIRQVSRQIQFAAKPSSLANSLVAINHSSAIKTALINCCLPITLSTPSRPTLYNQMAPVQRDIFSMLAMRGKKKKKEEEEPKKVVENETVSLDDEEEVPSAAKSSEAKQLNSNSNKSEEGSQLKRKRAIIEDDEEDDISQPVKVRKTKSSPSSSPKKRSASVTPPTSPKKANSKSTSPIKKPITAASSSGTEESENPSAVKSDSDEEYEAMEPDDVEEDKAELINLAKLDTLKPSVKLSTKLVSGKPIPYSAVVEVFAQIESTTKRLEIIKYTSDFFLTVLNNNPNDLIYVTYLFINRLGPDYEGLELGLGETILIKTIAESTGKSTVHVKAKYRETGDLGEIALKARSTQPTMFKPKALTVMDVFKNLKEIATTTGNNSQAKKIGIIKRMLTASQGLEAKFIIRSLESKLRIGLAEKTVLISLARALVHFQSTSKKGPSVEKALEAEEKIKEAFCQVPNYQVIIETALEHGVLTLDKHCTLKPGVPLKPMLAKPTKSITEVLDKFTGEEFTCEYKYDGERAQVHLLNDGTVKVYSRNSEDMSQRYPDIIDAVQGFLQPDQETKSLIIDCEAVAWSREENKILPFQVLTTRKRKDVELKDIKVHVCLFAFDILCLNGEPVINLPLKKRRQLLQKTLKEIPGKFQFATSKNSTDVEELQAFLDISIKDSCEGLMVKTLNNDPYRPSQRSNSWLKLKKDYLAGVGDSLDLIVIGAYYGKGKRTGTYGGFLLGCYNQDTEEIESCCKIGTGFSDDVLKSLYEKLQPTELSQAKSYIIYDSSAEPDIWFEPTVLFEVLTADLSLSPIYKAGIATLGKGVSLRFPRFMRLRDDKGIEDATSSDQVVEFYERQAHQQN
ncbi:hypothetical protein WICPIJ_007452 [Wickerhamomyces pijperi]|uniref:DNA ligase n=1 Tax=Wickerhamomyces pijperi TaxID=599730 RepID=A0A9P8Q075_WICPI|nr:hypothetical protein WICPIJ_007452 [Wickerhamomyces pijperi]